MNFKKLVVMFATIVLNLSVITGCGDIITEDSTTDMGIEKTFVRMEARAGRIPPKEKQEETEKPSTEEKNQKELTDLCLMPATVIHVVDGDTIHVNLDSESEIIYIIRIIGIDTPETVQPDKPVEPFGPEAFAFAKENLDEKQVWLEFDINERCSFGRLLAYVWTERPISDAESEVRSKTFNAIILLEGLAQVVTFPPNVKYVDMFIEFQREAHENNRGLWGE